jgi:cytochrome c556
LLFSGMLTLAGYRLCTSHVTAAVPAGTHPPAQNRDDLRKFMQARVHQEYTFLSFTIWHDRPLTAKKMDSIAVSSAHVVDMSRELTAYAAIYKDQGWSSDDMKFFEEKRLQLSRVAEELGHAAQKRNSPEVSNFFMHLDTTCQSCHKRFRPDLQWL